jgi:transposase
VNTIEERAPTERRRRRRYSEQRKAEVVAACQATGVSVAAVALEHGLNANLLRRWIDQAEGRLTAWNAETPFGSAAITFADVCSSRAGAAEYAPGRDPDRSASQQPVSHSELAGLGGGAMCGLAARVAQVDEIWQAVNRWTCVRALIRR